MHVCFFFTDGSRGGAIEVRDFKKRAKEGKSYMLSSLGLDKLAYETNNLTSYIYRSNRQILQKTVYALNSTMTKLCVRPKHLAQLCQTGAAYPV